MDAIHIVAPVDAAPTTAEMTAYIGWPARMIGAHQLLCNFLHRATPNPRIWASGVVYETNLFGDATKKALVIVTREHKYGRGRERGCIQLVVNLDPEWKRWGDHSILQEVEAREDVLAEWGFAELTRLDADPNTTKVVSWVVDHRAVGHENRIEWTRYGVELRDVWTAALES